MFLRKKTPTRQAKSRKKFDIRRIKASGMEVVGIVSLVVAVTFILFPQLVDQLFEHRFRPERYSAGFERLVETTRGAVGFSVNDEGVSSEDIGQLELPSEVSTHLAEDHDLAADPATNEFGEWRRR